MRWSPAWLALLLAASLPRAAAAGPGEPNSSGDATTPDSDNPGGAAGQPADQTDQTDQTGQADQGEPSEAAAPAAPAGRRPAARTEDDDEEAVQAPETPALDTVGGHLSLAPSAALVVPFGSLAQGASQSSTLGSGSAFGLDAGYGVSRTVVLGVWGQYLHHGAGSSCSSCSASGFALGPFLRYHLVQGMRFDPWMEAGLGFRSLHISEGGTTTSWSGIDWAHVAVGGDWYAFSNVGFGPFLALDASTFNSRPAGAGSSALAWDFTAGARIVFDLPGK